MKGKHQIYLVTNVATGKQYVGQTRVGIPSRWRNHIQSKTLLGRDVHRYGIESFTIEHIASATNRVDLNELETILIFQFDCLNPNGYNIAKGMRLERIAIERRRLEAERAEQVRIANEKIASEIESERIVNEAIARSQQRIANERKRIAIERCRSTRECNKANREQMQAIVLVEFRNRLLRHSR